MRGVKALGLKRLDLEALEGGFAFFGRPVLLLGNLLIDALREMVEEMMTERGHGGRQCTVIGDSLWPNLHVIRTTRT